MGQIHSVSDNSLSQMGIYQGIPKKSITWPAGYVQINLAITICGHYIWKVPLVVSMQKSSALVLNPTFLILGDHLSMTLKGIKLEDHDLFQ